MPDGRIPESVPRGLFQKGGLSGNAHSLRGSDSGIRLGPRFWMIAATWVCLVAFAACAVVPVHAESYTAEDVHNFISAYSSKYATPAFAYPDLVARSERVAACESDGFDVAVINDARRGPMGEVGVFQFLPGPRSIFWGTPSAAAGWDYWDAEANVAGAVWLISRGYGPRNWSCW